MCPESGLSYNPIRFEHPLLTYGFPFDACIDLHLTEYVMEICLLLSIWNLIDCHWQSIKFQIDNNKQMTQLGTSTKRMYELPFMQTQQLERGLNVPQF